MLSLLRNTFASVSWPRPSARKPPRKVQPRPLRRWGRISLSLQCLEERALLTAVPFGAFPADTGEFMLGDIYVTVVFMESEQIGLTPDPNLEDWSEAHIAETKAKIVEGLQWWQELLARHPASEILPQWLNFDIDFTYADNPVATGFEPIANISNRFQDWMYDFLDIALPGHSGSNFSQDIRAFNHTQRVANDANWAFTIFVVNSENDHDDAFAPGGDFDRAFAYAGGQFFVVPSGRPASTFAHETGHMFWARDEYLGGGSYTDMRGYYNASNVNAANNPQQAQEPSIMTSGFMLQEAYLNVINAVSTLEMIGWRDSNGNGIFDVLDVPHSLTGSGYYNAQSGHYLFQGESSVQTLPNQNSSGLRNDITINKISRVQYRVDGGPWQTAQSFGTYTAPLNLTLPVPSHFQTLEIQTIDDRTGVTSPIFTGGPEMPSSTASSGISGFVRYDTNNSGTLEANEVTGLAGWEIRLLGADGQTLTLQNRVEPEDFPIDTILTSDLTPGVVLTAIGSGVDNDNRSVIVREGNPTASTGNLVFRHFLAGTNGGLSADWPSTTRNLRIDFDSPVSVVSLDAISNSATDYGRLEVYDANDNLLARYTTQGLTHGQIETMTLSRPTADIHYAIARGHFGTAIQLDNLSYGAQETTVTDARGMYEFPFVPAGSYTVQAVAPSNAWVTTGSTQAAAVLEGQAAANVDFGVRIENPSAPFQNPLNRFDVTSDQIVTPLDAVTVISHLRQFGSYALLAVPIGGVTTYLDVSGDNRVGALDALQVISFLRTQMTVPAADPPQPAAEPAPGEDATAVGEGERIQDPRDLRGRRALQAAAVDSIWTQFTSASRLVASLGRLGGFHSDNSGGSLTQALRESLQMAAPLQPQFLHLPTRAAGVSLLSNPDEISSDGEEKEASESSQDAQGVQLDETLLESLAEESCKHWA